MLGYIFSLVYLLINKIFPDLNHILATFSLYVLTQSVFTTILLL